MTDLTKRDYLKLAGTGVGGIALLSGGFIITNDRNPASSNGGSKLLLPRVEPLSRDKTDVAPGDTVDDIGGSNRNGAESDSLGSGQNDPGNGDNRLDYERDDDGDIEYKTDTIDFEWEPDDPELDTRGVVDLRYENEGQPEFEYDDETIQVDYDHGELEYRGHIVELEWDHRSDEDDFKARKL